MLSHDAGVSLLASGGSIVTRISPDKKDWSAVIEKMSTSNSICECSNGRSARLWLSPALTVDCCREQAPAVPTRRS